MSRRLLFGIALRDGAIGLSEQGRPPPFRDRRGSAVALDEHSRSKGRSMLPERSRIGRSWSNARTSGMRGSTRTAANASWWSIRRQVPSLRPCPRSAQPRPAGKSPPRRPSKADGRSLRETSTVLNGIARFFIATDPDHARPFACTVLAALPRNPAARTPRRRIDEAITLGSCRGSWRRSWLG